MTAIRKRTPTQIIADAKAAEFESRLAEMSAAYTLPSEFPSLQGQGMISIDTEGHDPQLAGGGSGVWVPGYYKLAGVSVGTEAGFRQYYPVGHDVGPNLPKDVVVRWLKRELRTETPKIGANLLYDLQILQAEGIEVNGPLYDVQIAEPLLHEDRFSYKLGAIAKDYVGVGKKTEELAEYLISKFGQKNHMAHIGKAPSFLVAPYAISDVDLPLKIFRIQKSELEAQGLWNLFVMESKLIPMLAAMRRRGVRVNVDATEKMLVRVRDQYKELQDKVKRQTGVQVEPWEVKSFVRVFDDAGIPYPLTPKTQKPSFTAGFLEACEHPIAQDIVEMRKLDKLAGTFLEGSILNRQHNGVIHCNFNSLKGEGGGAVSGRFSSSAPNLQFIPVRTEMGRAIRRLFIAGEGKKWYAKDYCVAPHTRVMTTDLRWIRADEVRPGDELVGFDEDKPPTERRGKGSSNGNRRKLRRTKVQYTKRLTQPCYRITTDRGVLECSSEHRWLSTRVHTRPYSWARTKDIQPGDLIQRICEPWGYDESREGGWMAGFFDGEGSVGAQSHLGIGQNEGPVLDRCREYLRQHGYIWKERRIEKENGKTMVIILFQGGRDQTWKFLGSVRPGRLVPKIAGWHIEGRTVQSHYTQPGVVQSVEYLGEKEVIAIQTEHKTFVAEGFCSHNSQIEYRLMVHDAAWMGFPGADAVVQEYLSNPDADFHSKVAEMVFGNTSKESRTAAKTINFGLAYGEGKDKLAKQLGLALQDALALIEKYHARAPFMRRLAQNFTGQANKTGEVLTLLGRKRRFTAWEVWDRKTKESIIVRYRQPGARRAFTHKAMNARTQGSAADVMKKAMVDSWESGVYDVLGPPSLTVHDELDGDFEPTRASFEALQDLNNTMESTVRLLVPLRVDASTGNNWGDAK